MQAGIDGFRLAFGRVRALHGLHGVLVGQLTSAVDLSDLLRSEMVLAVSAFDYFVHEVTRIGMLESYAGTRPKTDAFQKFALPMQVANEIAAAQNSLSVFDTEIRIRHGYKTFQAPDNVADAIRLFSDVKLWKAVADTLGEDAKALKRKVSLIVDRRNKIAHEADADPSYPGQRWPIDRIMVENAFDLIEKVAEAIFKVACVSTAR